MRLLDVADPIELPSRAAGGETGAVVGVESVGDVIGTPGGGGTTHLKLVMIE